MNSHAHFDDPARLEALYRAAETKAAALQLGLVTTGATIAESPRPAPSALFAAALRELERLSARKGLLPPHLVSEMGWLVLLDLFVHEHRRKEIRLGAAAEQWQTSNATAARQIAALIESNLIMRVFGAGPNEPVTLRLTGYGRVMLAKVLAAHI